MEYLSYIPSSSLSIAILSLLCAFFTWRFIFRKNRGNYPPMVGSIFHQLYHYKRLHDYHTDLSQKHKTFQLFAPAGPRQFYTNDPIIIEYILKTNFQNYGKGNFNYDNLIELFGDGIFAVDGEKWREQRKLASFEFSTRVLRDFSGAIFKNNAAKLAHIISKNAMSNQPMDIQDLFMKGAMDSIFSIAFGTELNCLDGSKQGSEFAKTFDDSSEITMLRYVNSFWKIMRFLNIGSEAKLREKIKALDEFIYRIIKTRSDEISNGLSDDATREDFLSRFMRQSKKKSDSEDQKYLRDIILNFVIAGKDTTAGSLSWFFYMICKHPKVQEKVREEIKKVVNVREEATIEEFAQSITDEVLSNMHYLHAVLTETLRLYPVVPLNNKVCFSDDVLPNGFNIHKDDIVFYQPYAMGRMPYLWGNDAESFKPDRWLDVKGVFQPESPFKFAAFQAGPRICIGKDFAYRQMKIFSAVLLNFFQFKIEDESAVMAYRTALTLHIDKGLNLLATTK
ncbi:hypothetical protein LUZ60_014659 [Juncus effusus]|nr:hypothetical protein LUZ60_014659 [Juncus effusus]